MPDKPEGATEAALRSLPAEALAVLARSLAEAFRDAVGRAKVSPENSPESETLISTSSPSWLASAHGSEVDESLPEHEEKETGIGANSLKGVPAESGMLPCVPRSISKTSCEFSTSPDRTISATPIILAERSDLIPSMGRPIGVPPRSGATVRDSDPLPIANEFVPMTSPGGPTQVISEFAARPDRPAPASSHWTSTTITPPASQADFGLVSTAPRVALEAWGPSRSTTVAEPAEPEWQGFIPLSAPPIRNWAGIIEGPSVVPVQGEGIFVDSPRRPVDAAPGRDSGPDLEGSIERILSLLGEVLKTQRNHLPTARRPSRST